MKTRAIYTLIIYFGTILCSTAQNPQPPDTTLNQRALNMLQDMTVSYPVRFAVFGDPHYGNNNTKMNDILNSLENADPDFVICCGDLTKAGTEDDYDAFELRISSWMTSNLTPFFSLPGNHDFDFHNGFTWYEQYIGKENYYFDFGHRFMLINNAQQKGDDPSESDYKILNDTLLEIKNWLETMPQKGFMFAHIPLHMNSWESCGIFPGNCPCMPADNFTGPEPNYQQLHAQLKLHDINAFVAGHTHEHHYSIYDNVPYFITGGGGHPTATDYHWLLFTVNADGDILVEKKTLVISSNYPLEIDGLEINLANKSETTNKIYAAGNTITATNCIINSNKHIIFNAGRRIELRTGFKTENHSHFECNIIPDFVLPEDKIPQNKLEEESQALGENVEGIIGDERNNTIIDMQIYPNPFSSNATIAYELQKETHVKITLYNSLFIEEKDFVNEFQNKGIHHIKITGNGLKKGLYYCAIVTGDQQQIRKLIIQ